MTTSSRDDSGHAGRRRTVATWTAIAALLLLVAVGTIVRLTVRDRYLATALPYYVTPPASMTLLLLVAVFLLPRRHSRIRRFVALFMFVAAFWTGLAQWETCPEPQQDSAANVHKLMFWNVFRGGLGWDKIIKEIKQQNPDLIALAEVRLPENGTQEFFAGHFPDYTILTFPRDLALLSRIPVRDSKRLAWRGGGLFESVTFHSPPDLPFTLLLADVRSEVLLHRKQPIGVLVDLATRLDGPAMIVGDLNTPVDSVWFDPLRLEFRNAFEESGSGMHTTWPMPLPLLAIDHVWGNSQIDFQRTEIIGTMYSDHRAIITEFSMNRRQPVHPPEK